MEQQTETAPVDERRQRQLASLAKARAARAANVQARAAGLGPLLGKAHVPAKSKPRRKKMRQLQRRELMPVSEVAEVKKLQAENARIADNWLDGIHHAPNGCPYACNATRCAITGENVCAHPDTNLQARYLAGGFPEVVDRFNAARMELKRLDAERSLKK